jgi:hypothetical protein
VLHDVGQFEERFWLNNNGHAWDCLCLYGWRVGHGIMVRTCDSMGDLWDVEHWTDGGIAVAYATDVANIHDSWLPHGMFELRTCSPKLFVIDVTAGGYRGFERNMVLEPRGFMVARAPAHPTHRCVPAGLCRFQEPTPLCLVSPLFPFFPLSQYDTLLCGVQAASCACALHRVVLPINLSHLFFPSLNRCLTGYIFGSSFLFMTAFIVGE